MLLANHKRLIIDSKRTIYLSLSVAFFLYSLFFSAQNAFSVPISQLAAGHAHTAVIKTDGTLWAWGHNKYGQLGDGTTGGKSLPIQIGTDTDWQTVTAGYWHNIGMQVPGPMFASRSSSAVRNSL